MRTAQIGPDLRLLHNPSVLPCKEIHVPRVFAKTFLLAIKPSKCPAKEEKGE